MRDQWDPLPYYCLTTCMCSISLYQEYATMSLSVTHVFENNSDKLRESSLSFSRELSIDRGTPEAAMPYTLTR